MHRVVDLLKGSQSRAQLAYEVGRSLSHKIFAFRWWSLHRFTLQLTFILWTLTFCNEAIDKFVSSNALDVLVQLVVAAPREKVVRVALEALQVREAKGCTKVLLCFLTARRYRTCSAK